MKYYSAIKRDKVLIHATIWIKLEDYAKWKKKWGLFHEYKIFGSDENVSELEMITQHCGYTKHSKIYSLKCLILCPVNLPQLKKITFELKKCFFNPA